MVDLLVKIDLSKFRRGNVWVGRCYECFLMARKFMEDKLGAEPKKMKFTSPGGENMPGGIYKTRQHHSPAQPLLNL